MKDKQITVVTLSLNELQALIKNAIDETLQQYEFNNYPDWMTTKQAARYLQVSEAQIHKLVKRGELIPGRNGSSARYKKSDLKELFKQNL